MCPFCIATSALIVMTTAGVASAGGLGVAVIRAMRSNSTESSIKSSIKSQPDPTERKNDDDRHD
jgi:hypothetical protein